MNNLNCKMQAHARVCEENKLEETTVKDTYRNNFAVKGTSLKDHIRRVERHIKMMFSRMIHHSIKVLVICYVKQYCICKTTIGCCHGNEHQNSWTGWFLRMVRPI